MGNGMGPPTTATSAVSFYHPLFVFNQFGDCEGAKLRHGNVHNAHDWRELAEFSHK